MEISNMLTLSTGHITEETSELLSREPDDNTLQLTFYPNTFGGFLYVNNIDSSIIETLPQDLSACVSLAQKQNCQWLQFDCDADEIDELPTYDW